MYVPDHHGLKIELLAKLHDDPLAGHFASKKTKELVSRKFYWVGMGNFIEAYCDACGVCQGSRVIRGKRQGLLEPLPAPSQIWEQITMDFVTDLPPNIQSDSFSRNAYDAFLVIVDRLSKMVHFIPVRKSLKREDLATLFLREVVRLLGVPSKIIGSGLHLRERFLV